MKGHYSLYMLVAVLGVGTSFTNVLAEPVQPNPPPPPATGTIVYSAGGRITNASSTPATAVRIGFRIPGNNENINALAMAFGFGTTVKQFINLGNLGASVFDQYFDLEQTLPDGTLKPYTVPNDGKLDLSASIDSARSNALKWGKNNAKFAVPDPSNPEEFLELKTRFSNGSIRVTPITTQPPTTPLVSETSPTLNYTFTNDSALNIPATDITVFGGDSSFNSASSEFPLLSVGDEILTSGFSDPLNNGLFTVTSSTESRITVDASLASEEASAEQKTLSFSIPIQINELLLGWSSSLVSVENFTPGLLKNLTVYNESDLISSGNNTLLNSGDELSIDVPFSIPPHAFLVAYVTGVSSPGTNQQENVAFLQQHQEVDEPSSIVIVVSGILGMIGLTFQLRRRL